MPEIRRAGTRNCTQQNESQGLQRSIRSFSEATLPSLEITPNPQKEKQKDPSEHSPSIAACGMCRRDVHQADLSGEGSRSIRAQEGESHLIVWGEGLVCIGKHRSKVRTIEQILFKYSRDSISSIDTYNPASTFLRRAHGTCLSSSLHSCQGVATVRTVSRNARKMTAVVLSTLQNLLQVCQGKRA